MKTVRTITLHGGALVIPTGMTERELITLIGTLAVMQRVDAVYSSDYDKTFSYTEGACSVTVGQAEVYDTVDQAKAAREDYNTALAKKKELEALA
jgi:hypothetical protein